MNKSLPNSCTEWTFATWIERFKDVDLPIGDLANDILGDKNFPENSDFLTLLEYLSDKSHDNEHIMSAFTSAWNFYKESTDINWYRD